MLEIGERAPDFDLPGVDDRIYTLGGLLADYRAVAVIFSCNHCPYVRAWEGRMEAIQRDYAPRGAILVAINPNDAVKYPEDDFTQMTLRAREEDFNFPYLRDDRQEVARSYGAERTPQVFLVDGSGVLRYRGAIDDNCDDPDQVQHHYLRDALDAVLAGQLPDPDVTQAIGCTVKWA